MISSISGNSRGSMPGVGSSTKRESRKSEDTLAALFSRASLADTGRFDLTDFSAASALLGEPLLLPTARNVRELSADLSAKLSRIFGRAGLPTSMPVEFRVEPSTGLIRVGDSSSNGQRIEEIVNHDPELKRLFQTISAISTHAYEIPLHLKFQREYLASHNPEQVIAKYGSLFSDESGHDFSMIFDGGAIRTLVDGRVWNPPGGPKVD